MNPTPLMNGNYLWFPGTSDNVVPGLDSLISYIQSTYTTLTSLQINITSAHSNIQTEIYDLEIPNQGDVNVNNDLYYHSNYTEYTFQRNSTIHNYGSRRTFGIQQNRFTYQRKGNQELHVQLLNMVRSSVFTNSD